MMRNDQYNQKNKEMESKKKQFGWKRKIGSNISKSALNAFESQSKNEEEDSEVDWLSLVPVKRTNVIGLEDGKAKSSRLIQEGSVLASSERYWEALKKWDEALLYTPCDSKIHEMKAQVLMELCEVYPAVQAAMKAVECEPTWWIAHQTLGRAHLGLGEVRLALKSFSRAVHLNPEDRELWEDDLMWANSLLLKKQRLDEEKKLEMNQKNTGVTITELDNDESEACETESSDNKLEIYSGKQERHKFQDSGSTADAMKKLPNNYIQMRDPT